MTESRISLTRIIGINWYGFRQIIDVSGHALIAGSFGTGKTALLDLLQYVLLGSNWRPNRAAAGNAKSRSLVSYCLCDTNTLRNGEPHYIRSSGVTVIGLEFTWPLDEAGRREGAEPRRETWGMRIQFAGPTAEARVTWFGLPDRLEWEMVAPGGVFLDEDAFRTWVRREYGREALFSRQTDYLEEMASAEHLYFEADAFRRTLPRAIAFEPEENVEKFLREFVLEESPLDVRDVRAAVGAYRETLATLVNQEDEAERLREVRASHAELDSAREEGVIFRHVEKRLARDQAAERRDRARLELETLKSGQDADRAALTEVEAQLDEIGAVVVATRLEVQGDPKAVELDKLRRERANLHEKIRRLEEARKSLRDQAATLRTRWTSWLRSGDALVGRDAACAGLGGILRVDEAEIERLVSPRDAEARAAMDRLAEEFGRVWAEAAEVLKGVRALAEERRKRLQQLATDLETLDRNEELGGCPVFRAVREKLGDGVRQLGRLIEVREEADRWWPALELMLGARRLVIVVDRENYREALEIVRRTAPGREPESLLNPSEAERMNVSVRAGSLAEKIEVEDPVARRYVESLLGEVIGVETVEELDACPAGRAMTPEGIFKQVPLRRRLMPAGDVPLTLGVRGRERLRVAREREQIEVRREYDRLELLAGDFNAWLDGGKVAGLGARPSEGSADGGELANLQAEWRSQGATIELLATPERDERLAQLKEHEGNQRELDRKLGALKRGLEQFLRTEKKHEDDARMAGEKCDELDAELVQLRALLPPSVTAERIEAAAEAVSASDAGWTARIARAAERASSAEARVETARLRRENARRVLIESAHLLEPAKRHPQYRTDFDVDDEDNSRWSKRLEELEQIELPKYTGLAEDRRKDWENRLRESVLDRLKERLDKAENDIALLRKYLSHSVGRYRYSVTQRRDPAFQSIWSLLDTGFEPTDELLAGTAVTDSREALDELMRAVDASGGEIDERARRLLDYRHYHHYDIEMLLKDDPQAPAISLSRSMRSLSGGENQAPFFISMLAAFRRVYDLGSERTRHLGLVVMDEAFSKLSGDGVEDCLELARNFQLQLVMAFPIDRLGVMAPYADTVIICRKEEERDRNGVITRIDNVPQRITPAEAMESLD